MKQASGGDVGRHPERTGGMRNRAARMVPAQSRGPWHAAGNEGRDAAPKRWNATVSTGRGLKKAEKCGGDCPQLRIPRHKNTSFKAKPPCFTKTFTTFASSPPQNHSLSSAGAWCPGRIGLHLRGLRSILATRNGTATPSYKKHSSIAPNP